MEIFIQTNGSKEGPFSSEQIRERLQSGTIPNTTLAWHEGLSNWLPVMAVLTPRATPPQFRDNPEVAETNVLNETAKPNKFYSEIIAQSKALGWKNIIPINHIISDKPWNVIWVRWLFWFVGSLLVIRMWATQRELGDGQAMFLLATNWVIGWALALSFVIKPDRFSIKTLCLLLALSVGLTVLTLILASKVSIITSIFQATSSDSMLKRFSSILFTSILLQLFVIIPLLIVFVKQKDKVSASTLIMFGLAAGMGIGLAPALTILLQQKWHQLDGQSFGILNNSSILMLFTWPILCGLWGGIAGSFVASAVRNKDLFYGWIVASVLVPSILCASYLAFSLSLVGMVVVAVSILTFASYVKQHATS